MTVKLTRNILFTLIVFMFFTACAKTPSPVEATGPQSPTSEIEGFYEQQQTVSGGVGDSNLNLSDIQIQNTSESTTKITLTFGQGGQSEDKSFVPSKQVPIYQTSFIKGVNRMVFTFEGVSYYTYKVYQEELVDSMVSGAFAQRPINSDESKLYFNIDSDYAYKVEEIDNQIIITLHSVSTAEENKAYYVTLDAFSDYEEGLLNSSFPLKPTLSSDGENVILISKPFYEKSEAENFIVETRQEYSEISSSKNFNLIELNNSELPSYSQQASIQELGSTPIGYSNGTQISFKPIISNGRFLCYDSLMQNIAFAQPNTVYGDQEGDSLSFEYLYIQNSATGEARMLIDQQFTSITDAQFSSDSRYLAFIEQSDVLRKLQILSLEDGRLYVPAEDSFGVDTASFVWDDDANILYAINGEFQSKQLLSYDLTDPEQVVVKGVFEQEFSESILQIHEEKIYYANRVNGSLTSEICSVNITSGRCEKVAEGNSFLLSPDGSKLAISDISENEAGEEYRLRYFDIESGNEAIIFTGQIVNSLTWSANGERIYYSVYKSTGAQEEYPYELYYYDISLNQSFYMMDTVASALYAADTDLNVILMTIFTYKNQPIPMTYSVK